MLNDKREQVNTPVTLDPCTHNRRVDIRSCVSIWIPVKLNLRMLYQGGLSRIMSIFFFIIVFLIITCIFVHASRDPNLCGIARDRDGCIGRRADLPELQ